MMPGRDVNQTELAVLLGLSTRQIRNLEAEGLPHSAKGNRKLYPVPGAIQWYADRKKQEAVAEIETADYRQARARREAARARMAELELAKEEGRVIPRDVVDQVYGVEMLDRIRAGLLNFPGRWGAQVVGLDSPREGEAVLKRGVSELLEELTGRTADMLQAGPAADLPEGFPGCAVLVAAGLETFEDLLAADDLLSVRGVGPATERKIQKALAEYQDGEAA